MFIYLGRPRNRGPKWPPQKSARPLRGRNVGPKKGTRKSLRPLRGRRMRDQKMGSLKFAAHRLRPTTTVHTSP
eukprot:939099-Prymnesium_polylepis.1